MVVSALVLSACALFLKPEDSPKWYDSQRAVLTERAEARWQARMKQNIEAEYAYLSPAYRAVVSLQQYKGRVGNVIEWRLARVKDILYDSPTVASVSVEVTYRFTVRDGTEMESSRILIEKWLYMDGGWWYTAK